MQPSVIGIDLGGTAIKLGQFTPEGTCLQQLQVATPQSATPEAVLEVIAAAVRELDPQGKSQALGLGTPGPTDAGGRIARVAINLQGWHDVPVADVLEHKTGRSTILANDANCAGLGEAWLGAGRGVENLILVTLGTGVGGAIILDGRLFVGRTGAAGELGLITLNPQGPPCNSGNPGSLEQYASVQAIRRETGLEPHQLAAQAESGDEGAIAYWQQYGQRLGAGLASLVYVLTPEMIVLGGGIAAAAPLFLGATEAELRRRVLPSSREGLSLRVAELGNRAGMVGAAQLAWQFLAAKRG